MYYFPTFLQVLNIFLLLALGLILIKKNVFDKVFFENLNKFVANIALPCIAFSKMQQPFQADLLPSLFAIFLIGAIFVFGIGMLSSFCFRKLSKDRHAIFSHLATFSNSAFMGYPIIIAAFGEEALIYGVIFATMLNLFVWTLGVYWFGDRHEISIRKLLFNPTLLATTLGIVLFLANIQLPQFPLNAISLIGDTTTPLSMMIVGSQLVNLNFSALKDFYFVVANGIRLIIAPLLFFLIFRWIPLPHMVFDTIFLCLCMPGAAVAVIQAKLLNRDEILAAQAVAFSTLFSLFTIPLMLLMLFRL